MQNKDILINILRFIILILLQVFILNNINFLGFINPYLYIFFILIFPFNGNKALLIFLSFLLGLCIDFFGDSGGIHAAASVFIAYIRPAFLKFSFGVSYEHDSIKLGKSDFIKRFIYIALMVIIHHVILFSLEIFNTDHILLILKSTLFSSIFSIVLLVTTMSLFSRKS
ncbi:MAG: rod shape-determining protein MreD [Flavobacteriaceae bacterium]|nr:rod shape-determining protein MreD [Flavobacteriaceae bacterium]